MKTITHYIAIDGNEFDDQYKCQEYEKEILALRQKLCDVKFFDDKYENTIFFFFLIAVLINS